jgi:peptidoglycan/LPS O-acetylase OafA/YrhL
MMLSGYVMTQLLLSKDTSYGKYIFRRFMRLMPAFAVCLLIALLIRPLVIGHTFEDASLTDSEDKFYWWHILFHSTLLHGAIPHTLIPQSKFAFLVPAWSISLEWQFYLVLPFILMFLKKFKVLGFLFLAILCKVVLFHGIIEQYFDDAFLLVKLAFFLVGIALFILFNAPEFFDMAPLKFKLPSIAWNPLVELGTISYSTYLIHWPILTLLDLFIPAHSTILLRAVMLLTSIPLILLSSMLLYTYVEKPGIALGRMLTSKPRTLPLLEPEPVS